MLELMIVLAIGATLAAFAVPSYFNQVVQAHRMEAVAALYRAAQFLESNAGNAGEGLPGGLDQAPSVGTAVYRLRVVPADVPGGDYVLEAQPVESGPMHADACGVFVLDASGQRSNRDGNLAGAGARTCWSTR